MVPHATCASTSGTQHAHGTPECRRPGTTIPVDAKSMVLCRLAASLKDRPCPHKDSITFSKSSPHSPRRFTAILASFINPHPLPQIATVTCIRISVLPWKACLATPSKLVLSPPQHPRRALGQISTERYATYLAVACFPRIHSHRHSVISRASPSADAP
jgi:hypothetical protein